MVSKYPNADTSPERLAEIEHLWKTGQEVPEEFVGDLLAMLEERDNKIEYLENKVDNMRYSD